MTSSSVPRRRADAARTHAAVIRAAARRLAAGPIVDMQRLAQDAGVSRSTLYRHFASAEAVRAAVLAEAVRRARADVRTLLGERRPVLAQLREVVAALVAVGAAHSVVWIEDLLDDDALRDLAGDLAPLAGRVGELAGFDPVPEGEWVRRATAHVASVCLRAAAAADEVAVAAQRVFDRLTAPLDAGLVAVDAGGRLLGANGAGAEAMALGEPGTGEAALAPQAETYYEDGTRAPADTYPIARAVLASETQEPAVRAHRADDGELRWLSIRVYALRARPEEGPYAILASFVDVTEQRDADLRRLQPPGELGRREPVPLDVARVLDAVPAALLPEQLIAEARRLVEVPVALYVIDIDGTHLLRLAGTDDFPQRLAAPLALGPELARDGVRDLRDRLARELPGAVMAPLWLRGRAVGALLAFRGRLEVLEEIARQAAPAMELANGYTDVFDGVRRRKDMNPAAEIQQSLLPPRMARLGGGEIAGGVLPSYETGGDWFDYVENRDGAWIAIADAAGRGARAAALGSVALAALRAARRNDESLEGAVQTMHETMCEGGDTEFFLTAIVARWSPVYASFSWVNAGHPPPLLLRADGVVVELLGATELPLGLAGAPRSFRRNFRRLEPGERIILYTDGVSARPLHDGLFGTDGIAAAVLDADGASSVAIARSVLEAVSEASDRPLRDDAAVVVLSPGDA